MLQGLFDWNDGYPLSIMMNKTMTKTTVRMIMITAVAATKLTVTCSLVVTLFLMNIGTRIPPG
jgi:hypothetical protein